VRVLSLIASSTEIVYALGCGDQLVGRSHECDFPKEVLELPYCTEPRFNTNGTSRQIDERVKSVLQQALSVYKIDEHKLSELNPDLIITQSQCDVCAVSFSDVESAVNKLLGKKPNILSCEPNQLSDIYNDINKVALSLDVEDKGKLVTNKMENRINSLISLVKDNDKKSVICIEWIDPLMAAGNWVPELIEIAGGINLFGQKGMHSPWMEFEELFNKDPDIIIVMPCGYNIEKCELEMDKLKSNPRWEDLRAVRDQNVFLTDGNQFFNRPGPRLIDSIEILIEIIHEKKYNFNHENSGWKKFES